MKKQIIISIILIVVVFLIVLSGCRKKVPIVKDPSEELEPTEEVTIEEIMKDFNNIVESKNSPDKIVAFIDENIEKLSQIEGDEMLSELERALEKFLESETNKIFDLDKDGELIGLAGEELFFPKEKVQEIKNDELRTEIIRVLDSKYKLINLEGNYYPIVDYEKLQEYDKNISDELKDYFAIKALDSNMPVAIDGGLYISYDELSQRILKIEDFTQRYSGGQRHEEMLKAYRDKLSIYLLGIDNSPIADEETQKIHQDLLNSYKKTANIKDAITSFILNKYVNLIEENDYIVNQTVKENVLSLINEALSLLEASK